MVKKVCSNDLTSSGAFCLAESIVSQSENVVDIRKTCYGIYSV